MTLILSGTDGLSDVDGSAATPAIRGTDANTGIFFPAADVTAIGVGGAEICRVAANGLGIGATSIGAKLVVSGTGNIARFGDGTNTFDIRFQGPNNWAQQLNTSTDVFSIQRNSTDFFSVNPSGSAVLRGAVTSADGIGITFPASQTPSSNANTLDDYEEGTFTPNVFNNGSSSTFTIKNGSYVKIGRMAYVYARFDGGTSGTAGGALLLSNLPFSVKSSTGTWNCIGIYGASGGTVGNVVGDPSIVGTTVQLWIGSGQDLSQRTFVTVCIAYEVA
jgi:hypothetical protein